MSYKKEIKKSEEYCTGNHNIEHLFKMIRYEILNAYSAGYLEGQKDLIEYSEGISKASSEKVTAQ